MILYFEKSSNAKKKINKYLLIFLSICFSIVFFFCFGIYFANTEWFNNHIYIRNKQMQLLNTKSSWKLEKELFNASYSYELYDIAEKLYTNYHEYYLKVTKNILESEWTDNVEKEEFMLYVKDYEKRKKQMINSLFPKINEEFEYGSMLNYLYPKMLKEFDRNELLTYKFMLEHSYNSFYSEKIKAIFSE